MLPRVSIATLVSKLANPARRSEAARDLAVYLGAEDLIIFIKDPEIDLLLPAPGFPQTLPAGRVWRAFLVECARVRHHNGQLPFPDERTLRTATGVVADDGSLLVLLGGIPDVTLVTEVSTLVPLLAAAFRGERAVAIAEGQVQLAHQSATQARVLANALDLVRHELQRALHARDEFLSIAAHELKTPLTSLLGYLQVFKRRAAREGHMNERDHATLLTIDLQAHRLHKMVNDLFDLSRIETGILTIERRPLDLTLLCKRLTDEVQPVLEKHSVALQADGPVLVEGDDTRLEQVLQNLLDNAIKYSPEGGEIVVEVARRDEHGCMSVSDQGIGIPEASRSKLFERFYRAGNVESRSITGLGIGLFLVHEIVTSHGGTVEVTSQVGRGSTFTVCLPLLHNTVTLHPLDFSASPAQQMSSSMSQPKPSPTR
ncbi:MAG: HAMP domain-containing sensor histidine kinase [Chloroflexia bacterium]